MNEFEILNIRAVKFEDGTYLLEGRLDTYFINEVNPEPTFEREWWKVNSKPETIGILKHLPNFNHRYVLKDMSLASKKIKKEMAAVYDKEECEWIFKPEYSNYKSLYELVFDEQDPVMVKIPFKLNVIMNVQGEFTQSNINFEVQNPNWSHEGITTLTREDVTHQLLDKIIFPPVLLPQRPCKFTSKQSYDIVRQYIKSNINPKYAEITSDYDFCFTVKKKIQLAVVEKYTVDVNFNLFGKKKKPKPETRYRKQRLEEIFEMTYSPKAYGDYTPIKEFQGESHEDLKNKIDSYCKDLIEFINEPLKDCPHCKGLGVILDKNIGGNA